MTMANKQRGNVAIRLEDVTKSFGDFVAVSNLSLEVPTGTVYGFIGPNGSGKTTTIRMILHIFMADSGKVEVLEEEGIRSANDRVGYLPEERGLYKKMTVRQVLGYYGGLKGMNRQTLRSAIDEWLVKMDIEKWGNQKVEKLSKGMAQKIQFIGAVISRPDLLILDEPFSGLDPVNREVIQKAILDYKREGKTIIFSTHDMRTAEELCDSIFMIFKGKKVLDGSLDSIQKRYGEDTIRVRIRGGASVFQEWDAVKKVRDEGNFQDVIWEGEPQVFLRKLMETTEVEQFQIVRPSLQDIFLRIAGPESKQEILD